MYIKVKGKRYPVKIIPVGYLSAFDEFFKSDRSDLLSSTPSLPAPTPVEHAHDILVHPKSLGVARRALPDTLPLNRQLKIPV